MFAVVMKKLTELITQKSLCTAVIMDGIVIYTESREQVEEGSQKWCCALDMANGSQIKTKYLPEQKGCKKLRGENKWRIGQRDDNLL